MTFSGEPSASPSREKNCPTQRSAWNGPVDWFTCEWATHGDTDRRHQREEEERKVEGGGRYRFDALEELVESAVGVAGEEDARRRRGRRGGGHWGWVFGHDEGEEIGSTSHLGHHIRKKKSFGPP